MIWELIRGGLIGMLTAYVVLRLLWWWDEETGGGEI